MFSRKYVLSLPVVGCAVPPMGSQTSSIICMFGVVDPGTFFSSLTYSPTYSYVHTVMLVMLIES
jgi:hypothetical protein